MIILPDRNIPRSRFLMPVHKREWMAPSIALPKDEFGRENRVFFSIRARLHDGFIAWRGVFEDREDFDAFLWALVNKTLRYERALWDLCTPSWNPDLPDDLVYDFATEVPLTTSPGSTLQYTSPSDWNNLNNKIECLGGAGGGGAAQGASSVRATGGGGGGYASATNYSFASPGVTQASYSVGTAGAGGSNAVGAAGGASWFGSTTILQGGGGGGGQRIASSTSALSGGTAGAGSGTSAIATNSGGRGGNISAFSNTNYVSTGAGGGGGPNGAGANGLDLAALATSTGGSGDAGTGGAGGAGGTAGGNGTEWGTTATYGSGGGAGNSGGVTPGPAGGNYGGGGGPNLRGAVTPVGGAGRQGLIYITYEPRVSVGFNMPILGL